VRRRLAVLVCAAALLGAARPQPETRLLFIGNSLTQANNLPELVVSLAKAAGKRAGAEMVATGGFGLEDHWNQGDAQKAIARGGWSVVILQQGPSLDRKQDFAGVSRSYAAAANDVHGLLFTAGDAWRAAWARDASLALYGPDNFHPSPMGSYLAALVITRKIFDVSPVGLPAPAFAPGVARLLQDVAANLK